jgi:hypothetical protein
VVKVSNKHNVRHRNGKKHRNDDVHRNDEIHRFAKRKYSKRPKVGTPGQTT